MRYLAPLIPLALIAAALGFVASQPHHRRCRVVPVPTQASHLADHIDANKFVGFAVVSPSTRCARCHERWGYEALP